MILRRANSSQINPAPSWHLVERPTQMCALDFDNLATLPMWKLRALARNVVKRGVHEGFVELPVKLAGADAWRSSDPMYGISTRVKSQYHICTDKIQWTIDVAWS